MGTKRVGLARIEALMEALKRDINLTSATLTDCTIVSSAAATFSGRTNITGRVDSNYIKFVSRDWNRLSLVTKTDANADSGFTMANETVHQVAALGDASNAIVLPAATLGALTVFRWTAQADGGSNITFTAASGDFYQGQTLNIPVLNLANGFGPAPLVLGNSWVDTVAIGGGTIATAAAGGTDNTLTLTHTATDNQTNIGAEIAFFCETLGYWRVSWIGSELGSGALNTNFAFSAV